MAARKRSIEVGKVFREWLEENLKNGANETNKYCNQEGQLPAPCASFEVKGNMITKPTEVIEIRKTNWNARWKQKEPSRLKEIKTAVALARKRPLTNKRNWAKMSSTKSS